MYTPQRFPLHLQYVATRPSESWKSKNVAVLQHPQQTVDVPEDTLRTWFNV